MSVQELENEVRQLPPAEREQFAEWFERFQEEEWDRQIAQDDDSGRFDSLMQRANANFEAGQCKPL